MTVVSLASLVTILEVLDGGVAAHSELLASLLAGSSAVSVSDRHGRAGGEFLSELVPSGLHGLAVTAPGSEELDEGVLGSNGLLQVGVSDLLTRVGQ